MADFTITEDFSKNQIECDKRFSDPIAVLRILFEQNGLVVSSVKGAANSAKVTYKWDQLRYGPDL